MTDCFFDHRWCGPHGIGRFASEIRQRLSDWIDVPLEGSPTAPTDSLRVAACLSRCNAAAFFSPGFNVPAWTKCPVVCTIHDLIHVHFAAESSLLKRGYYRFVQAPIVRRAPVTLTVSEYSRQQIVEWYGVPEDRVVVVGNGVSPEFSETGKKHVSDLPYVLYVGNAKPHGQTSCGLKLATVPTDELLQQVANLPNVEFCSGVDDRKLAELYRGASAVVLPSYYEGFGLPLVEAMACGSPVIASNRTSIPEVLDGAGFLFEPDDVDQLATLMSSLIRRSDDRRDQRRQRGLERAATFRWSLVADRVKLALERAVND